MHIYLFISCLPPCRHPRPRLGCRHVSPSCPVYWPHMTLYFRKADSRLADRPLSHVAYCSGAVEPLGHAIQNAWRIVEMRQRRLFKMVFVHMDL